eukprot:339718_1
MSFTKFNYTKDKVQCQENGSCILTMNKNEIIMFSGYVRIHVTKGKIKINGYIINATTNNDDESNYYNLYSIPYWKHNCLSIKSLINSQIHLYRFDFISKYQIKQSPQTCDSIFNITGCHFFLNKLTSHQYKPLSIPLSWEKSSNYFVESSNINNTIMICGRTQTGKSTYSNYLINSLLNKYSQIAYLDCDIGQSEFNPEGIISITIITYPLFGASHTHQHNMKNIDKYYKCLKSYYYGSNNPMDNPEFYLQCIYKLYSHWIEFVSLKNKNIPLIINTLGWTKSLGSNILKSLIINISPNNLIEIHDKNEPLFSSIEMGYLSEVKDMFIQQNKIHNWCDNNYKLNKKNKLNNNNNNNNSLVNSWWKQLTTNDEFSIKEYKELKPNQKKWFKYLNNLVELKFQSDNQNINHNAKWYNNINISNDKLCKTNQEMQLFKAFINAHVHYIKSVSKKIFENNNFENNDERIKNMIKLRKD